MTQQCGCSTVGSQLSSVAVASIFHITCELAALSVSDKYFTFTAVAIGAVVTLNSLLAAVKLTHPSSEHKHAAGVSGSYW